MAKETMDKKKKRAGEIAKRLERAYPAAKISLDYSNPLELLVATILSAQCTDERVNQVTSALFKKYPAAKHYADAPQAELEQDVRSTGFYKNKANAIRKCCADIAKKHGGHVPGTMEELTALAGVGRKTANVILGAAFGVPGVVVDTHVTRVSGRLGLTTEKNADNIEQDLMALIPKKDWTSFSTRTILFGRNTCKARKPLCNACPLLSLCPWDQKTA